MKRNIMIFVGFALFLLVSFLTGFTIGMNIGNSFVKFTWSLIKVVPFAFILIGLFEVWIPKETVEKHLGENSRFKGYFWSAILASTTVGGLFVALPIAAALAKKGARIGIIFTYLGAATVCRIPMTVFEATFVGVKFTLIRFLVSLPLIIITAELMSLLMPHFKMKDVE